MSSVFPAQTQKLLDAARNGGTHEVGQLLISFTNYLRFLAKTQLDGRVRKRVSESDLIQETLMDAHRDFTSFRGESAMEFAGWMRRIFLNNLIGKTVEHLRTEKRSVRREISLQELQRFDRSGSAIEIPILARTKSPSFDIRQVEDKNLLADTIIQLPVDQRHVIVARHLEGKSFEQIAIELNRTPGACRMLWLRAIKQLRQLLQDRGAT